MSNIHFWFILNLGSQFFVIIILFSHTFRNLFFLIVILLDLWLETLHVCLFLDTEAVDPDGLRLLVVREHVGRLVTEVLPSQF